METNAHRPTQPQNNYSNNEANKNSHNKESKHKHTHAHNNRDRDNTKHTSPRILTVRRRIAHNHIANHTNVEPKNTTTHLKPTQMDIYTTKQQKQTTSTKSHQNETGKHTNLLENTVLETPAFANQAKKYCKQTQNTTIYHVGYLNI